MGAGNLRLDQAEVVHGDLVDGAMSEPALPVRVAVTSVPQADRTYRAGEDIVIEVQFSRGVTVTGAPQLELALGAAGAPARRASYISAHDDTIRFRYAVQAGDRDADGIGIPTGALQLDGATIVDVLGEAVTLGLEQAQLVLPADKVDGAAADATPPAVRAVAIVSRPAAAGYAYGDRVSVAGRVQRAGGGYRQSATGAGRRQRQPPGRHRARNRRGARRAGVRLHGAGGVTATPTASPSPPTRCASTAAPFATAPATTPTCAAARYSRPRNTRSTRGCASVASRRARLPRAPRRWPLPAPAAGSPTTTTS